VVNVLDRRQRRTQDHAVTGFRRGPGYAWLQRHSEELAAMTEGAAAQLVLDAGLQPRAIRTGNSRITADVRGDRINLLIESDGIVTSSSAN
jgi:hypothetical protein